MGQNNMYFYLFIHLLIALDAPGLRSCMNVICILHVCIHTDVICMKHTGPLAAYGIQFPDQGLTFRPLHWESGVLVTGSPEKSPK